MHSCKPALKYSMAGVIQSIIYNNKKGHLSGIDKYPIIGYYLA